MKKFLHLGCGFHNQPLTTTSFRSADWKEIRVDIDPRVQPDIQASLTDLSVIPTGMADAAYLSHVIEHVYLHQVSQVLQQVRRVLLPPAGYVLIRCPDLQGIAALVAEGKLEKALYMTPSEGPITPHDMIYGHTRSLARGIEGMAHRCGFTFHTLMAHMQQAGFAAVAVERRERYGIPFELWAIGTLTEWPREKLSAELSSHQAVR